MSGQSAALSLKEAKAMQERTQCGTNHSHTNGGGSKSMSSPESHRKKAHKGQMHDHANVDHH